MMSLMYNTWEDFARDGLKETSLAGLSAMGRLLMDVPGRPDPSMNDEENEEWHCPQMQLLTFGQGSGTFSSRDARCHAH